MEEQIALEGACPRHDAAFGSGVACILKHLADRLAGALGLQLETQLRAVQTDFDGVAVLENNFASFLAADKDTALAGDQMKGALRLNE